MVVDYKLQSFSVCDDEITYGPRLRFRESLWSSIRLPTNPVIIGPAIKPGEVIVPVYVNSIINSLARTRFPTIFTFQLYRSVTCLIGFNIGDTVRVDNWNHEDLRLVQQSKGLCIFVMNTMQKLEED